MCLYSSGVEHFPRKEKVVGSNPTGGSTSAVTRAGFRCVAAVFSIWEMSRISQDVTVDF